MVSRYSWDIFMPPGSQRDDWREEGKDPIMQVREDDGKTAGMKALDIGSGHRPVEKTGWWKEGDMNRYDFVNLDLHHSDASLRFDFNETPYPFKDDSFDAVFARHTLEHVRRDKLVDVIKEIHRVAKDGALVYVRVPYWNSESFAGDPTHYNPFSETTFKHFCYGGFPDTDFYNQPLFEMLSITYKFHPKLSLIPKTVLRNLYHILSDVCNELWVILRVVKDTLDDQCPVCKAQVPGDSPPGKNDSRKSHLERLHGYRPEVIYESNEPIEWSSALFYGAVFYGAIGITLLLLLNLVGLI
jgi:SAM-dependent methyltransferase